MSLVSTRFFLRSLVCCFQQFELLKMLSVLILFNVATVLGQECYDDGNEFCIDQNDILSVDLLPGSFLFFDQYRNDNKSKVVNNSILLDGSYETALNQMNYHR